MGTPRAACRTAQRLAGKTRGCAALLSTWPHHCQAVLQPTSHRGDVASRQAKPLREVRRDGCRHLRLQGNHPLRTGPWGQGGGAGCGDGAQRTCCLPGGLVTTSLSVAAGGWCACSSSQGCEASQVPVAHCVPVVLFTQHCTQHRTSSEQCAPGAHAPADAPEVCQNPASVSSKAHAPLGVH
jgi:hypothetical protein